MTEEQRLAWELAYDALAEARRLTNEAVASIAADTNRQFESSQIAHRAGVVVNALAELAELIPASGTTPAERTAEPQVHE